MRALVLVLVLLLTACAVHPFAPETHSVAMRDGIRLSTDVYLPTGAGPFPTILVRTPYGRTGDQYHARALNQAGVAVVGQDTRGRFGTGDVDDGLFITDAADGEDTMAWIAAQPWSNGDVGMMGASALGITQYLAAPGAPELLVFNAEFATPNLYSDTFFNGGVRRYALTHNWLVEQGSLAFESELARPAEDEFWDSIESRDDWGRVGSAGYHVGGWFDIFSQGTLDAFAGYQYQGGPGAVGNQKLVIGPWTHNAPWGVAQGELRFPDNARFPPHDDVFDVMFNHWLGIDHPEIHGVPSDIPAVQYYVMGDVDDSAAPGNVWRMADDWPPDAAGVRWYLRPEGVLAEQCPTDGATGYTSNPDDPTPTICGNNLTIDAGPCDQRMVEQRDDVVVFETAVLDAPVEVTGRMRAVLFVSLDQPDTDLMVRLTDVYPDGRSMLITDGAQRVALRSGTLSPLSSGEPVEVEVDLWSTSIIINEGHRLRASIASSNWPRFSVNQNNGLPYPESVDGSGSQVRVSVHHDAERASYLELPDPTRDPTTVVRCD